VLPWIACSSANSAGYASLFRPTLISVATRGGPAMFARIGIMRALNLHVERVFDPSRKETHWGKRKLARDH
jgi:hypothetical protein